MTDSFTFEGREIGFRPGQSLAAALTAAGARGLRETRSGGVRGVFCGMGVCQECLVEVDGRHGVRACMTAAAPGISVRRSPALPALGGPIPGARPARRETPEILVIGGGAGGLSAAAEAAAAGAGVLLLDERKVPGGQYYKQAATGRPLDAQQEGGARLLARAREAGVEILQGAEIWGAFGETAGPLILAEHEGTPLVLRPRAVIVATGAHERPRIVPGWESPGVMTTGAAQTLWRSYRTLPGRRVAVAGSGPLNAQVALELARGGADIAALAEAGPAPWTRPAAVARMAAADPALTAAGARMIAALTARRVRMVWRHVLERVEPAADGLLVTLRGPGGPMRVTVDALCMNYGFQPSNEILRLLGVDFDHDARFGQLRCRRDAEMATSVAGVFAVGDCCGLGGAPAAVEEGAIAGRAAARAAGRDAPRDGASGARLARHRRFQEALWSLHPVGLQDIAALPDETLVCRCEEVTAGALRAALAGEAAEIGSLKRATRAGMGRCQGRYCGPVLAGLTAARMGRPLDEMAHFAPRAPVKPVSVATVMACEDAGDA